MSRASIALSALLLAVAFVPANIQADTPPRVADENSGYVVYSVTGDLYWWDGDTGTLTLEGECDLPICVAPGGGLSAGHCNFADPNNDWHNNQLHIGPLSCIIMDEVFVVNGDGRIRFRVACKEIRPFGDWYQMGPRVISRWQNDPFHQVYRQWDENDIDFCLPVTAFIGPLPVSVFFKESLVAVWDNHQRPSIPEANQFCSELHLQVNNLNGYLGGPSDCQLV